MASARDRESGRTVRIERQEPPTGTHPAPGAPITGTHTIPRQRPAPDGRPRPTAQRQRAPRTSRERGKEPKSRSSDLLGRVLVAVPAVILAVSFADFGGVGWMLLMALLALACVSELYRMLDSWRPLQMAGFIVVAGMSVAAYYGGSKYLAGAALMVLPLCFLGLMERGDTDRATLAVASTVLGVLWIGFAFAHGVLLRDAVHGQGLIIDVMVGTFVADIAAYFGGRWFGRHPLAPRISPNKTVEGLCCGAIAAVLAVFCAGVYQSWLPHGTALLIGLAIAVVGPLGDLFESMLKRDNGVKDAGTMFGAHGGALDRLDAISFTIIAVYYIWVCVPH